MNECPVKIKIQQQVNESGELNNFLNVLLQGDVCHIVGDIQARRITHDEKEKIQSEFTSDSKLKPSTLYWKKLLILKSNHLLVEIVQVQVDYLSVFKIYPQKKYYILRFFNPLCETN